MDILVELRLRSIISVEASPLMFRLIMQVSLTEAIPREVFVFQRDLKGVDTFYAVATPQHFELFSAIRPAEGQNFFRVERIELSFTTLTELLKIKAKIEKELGDLTIEYQKILSALPSDETLTFRAP